MKHAADYSSSTGAFSLAVAGGGNGGILTIVNFLTRWLEAVERGKISPHKPVRIDLIDPSGKAGATGAFPDTPKSLYSNTPVMLSEPYAHKSLAGRFTAFAAKHGCKAEDCFPRHIYGAFEKEELQAVLDRVQKAGLDLAFHIHKGAVSDAKKTPGGNWEIKTDTGLSLQAQELVLALGPLPSGHVFGFDRKADNFIDAPLEIEKIRKISAQSTPDTELHCLGFGPTALDLLGALEETGYKGRVVFLGPVRDLWPLEAARFAAKADEPFEPVWLKAEALPEQITAATLDALFKKELQDARDRGYCRGHVLGLDVFAQMQDWGKQQGREVSDEECGAFAHLQKQMTAMLGIATAPERIDLYNRWKNEGRIAHYELRVDAANITQDRGGKFLLPVEGGADRIEAALFAHAAPFGRDYFTPGGQISEETPAVLKSLFRLGHITEDPLHPGAFAPEAKTQGLHLGWMETNNRIWGVGIAAEHYDRVSDRIFTDFLRFSLKPDRKNAPGIRYS